MCDACQMFLDQAVAERPSDAIDCTIRAGQRLLQYTGVV